MCIRDRQGAAFAEGVLGAFYQSGEGVAKDPKKAFEWIQKAARQGNADTEYTLGVYYRKGYGVVKNPKKSFEWVQKAAQQGYPPAQIK